jgi:hypothetical protein
MTKEEITRMAREAGLMVETSDGWDVWQPDNIESFVALVEQERGKKYPIALTHEQYNVVVEAAIADGAAAEREKLKHELLTLEKWKGMALAKNGDGRTVQEIEREAREAEREAIAQMIEDSPPLVSFAQNEMGGCVMCGFTPKLAALTIRERGAP